MVVEVDEVLGINLEVSVPSTQVGLTAISVLLCTA